MVIYRMEYVLQYWLNALMGAVLAVIGIYSKHLGSKIKKEVAEREAVKVAMVALLHDRLFQCCQFHIKNGYIPLADAEKILDNMEMLYTTYTALGGNGTGTEIYKRARALPIKNM